MILILRPPLWQRALPVVGLLCLAALVVGAGVDLGGWVAAFGAAVVPVAVAGMVRGWALRVEAGEGGLVLVNWGRTVRVPWVEVARVGHDSDGVYLRRRDGREVRASAFQHGSRAFGFAREPARVAARRLEELRRRR
ncbi:PH domain-containing protein [Actinoplanes sp. CA-054009]